LIDDEQGILETVSASLRHNGFNVHTSTSGHKALASLEMEKDLGEPFDAIVSDVRMGDGSFGDLFSGLVSTNKDLLPDCIILISGFSDYSKEDLEKFSVHAFLSKPFEHAELIEILDRFFKNSND